MEMKRRISVIAVLLVIIAAIILVYPPLQRRRDLNETLQWIDQTYNPPAGGDVFQQGHGWERHYVSQTDRTEKLTEEFHTTFSSRDGCNVVIYSETSPLGVYSETPSQSEYTFNLRDIDPSSVKIKRFDLHKDVFDCSDGEQVQLYNLNCNAGEVYFKSRRHDGNQ